MAEHLYQRIAEHLRVRLVDDPTYVPPSLSVLADEFEVAYTTMWRAVRVLVEAGVVSSVRGRRIRRLDVRKPPSSPNEGTPGARLAARLREQILDGTHQPFDRMPKFEYIEAHEHVTRATIVAAYRVLQSQHLVHKQGKSWFVGPGIRADDSVEAEVRDQPVAIMLMESVGSAFGFFENNSLASFTAAYNGVLLRKHIRLLPVLYDRDPVRPLDLPGGIDELRRVLHDLKHRYIGALAMGPIFRQPNAGEYLRELSRGDRMPVVYFDNTIGEGRALVRSAVGLRRNFYRLYHNEEAVLQVALEHLVRFGHRRIGHPTFTGTGSEYWPRLRLEALQRVAARMEERPTIVPVTHTEDFWVFPAPQSPAHVAALYDRVTERDTPNASGVTSTTQARFLRTTPSMVELLRQGVTAVVSINDALAYQHYLWLRSVGLSIPRHLSLISLDNQPFAAMLPVTTVDFGFAALGHLAAHILIGDLAVSADREGSISASPTLVTRGSVARTTDVGREVRRIVDAVG